MQKATKDALTPRFLEMGVHKTGCKRSRYSVISVSSLNNGIIWLLNDISSTCFAVPSIQARSSLVLPSETEQATEKTSGFRIRMIHYDREDTSFIYRDPCIGLNLNLNVPELTLRKKMLINAAVYRICTQNYVY